MAEKQVTDIQFEWLKDDVASIKATVEKIDNRLDTLERRMDKADSELSVIRRVSVFALTILGALVTAWVSSLLGL